MPVGAPASSTRSAEDGEQHEPGADQRRVEPEELRNAAGNAPQQAIVATSRQATVRSGPVDLREAMRQLHDHLGVETIVATGGGRLGGALLRAGLVGEIDLEALPVAIG